MFVNSDGVKFIVLPWISVVYCFAQVYINFQKRPVFPSRGNRNTEISKIKLPSADRMKPPIFSLVETYTEVFAPFFTTVEALVITTDLTFQRKQTFRSVVVVVKKLLAISCVGIQLLVRGTLVTCIIKESGHQIFRKSVYRYRYKYSLLSRLKPAYSNESRLSLT